MSKEVGFLKVRTLVSLKSGSSEIVQFLGRREERILSTAVESMDKIKARCAGLHF